jgi:hypothetical protein
MVLWVAMHSISEEYKCTKQKKKQYYFLLLLVFIFDPEDGGERFLQNIVLSLNYIILQTR